jgi:hypothetical protein
LPGERPRECGELCMISLRHRRKNTAACMPHVPPPADGAFLSARGTRYHQNMTKQRHYGKFLMNEIGYRPDSLSCPAVTRDRASACGIVAALPCHR